MVHSDQNIRDAVAANLAKDARIDASNIDVQASEGVVTLSGTTNSYQEKYLAKDDTKAVTGVRKVENKIKVVKGNKEPAQASAVIRGGVMFPGMKVFGSDGDYVGNVKYIYSRQFFLDRPFAVDMLIPLEHASIQNDRVILDIRGDDIHLQGFRTPSW